MKYQSVMGYLAVLVCAWAEHARAAEVYVESSPTPSGIAHSIYLDDTGLGEYNAIGVDIYPDAPASFLNFDGDGFVGSSLLLPGADATFTNPVPYIPILDSNWVLLGASDDGPQEIDYGAGPLGQWINLSAPLFLNNVVLPLGATGTATITLFNTGFDVFRQTVVLGVPEPGTFALAGICLAACLSRRFQYS